MADEATSDEEAELAEQFECMACDKIFKSEKALTNHTRSAQPLQLHGSGLMHSLPSLLGRSLELLNGLECKLPASHGLILYLFLRWATT